MDKIITPKVTVLMSVYNGGKYLHASINSILNQTFCDFELLIINDGSSDSTIEILKEYAERDKRLRIHDQNNYGLVFALNKGIELARGKYIARIDADDIMKQNRIAEQVAVLELQENVAVVGSWMSVINEKGAISTNWELPYTSKDCDYWSYLNGDTRVGHPCVMYRTDVVRYIKGYRAEYIHAEDVDLWFRIELAGHSIVNIPKYLTLYRLHDCQITKQYDESSKNSRNKALAYFLSSKLDCVIDSKKAALMIPANYTKLHFNQQMQLNNLYELKLKMFALFSQKHNLTAKEIYKYSFKVWLSLLPLCKLRFTNPFKVIFLNTMLFFQLTKR